MRQSSKPIVLLCTKITASDQMHRIASGNMHWCVKNRSIFFVQKITAFGTDALVCKTDRSSLYKQSQHSVQMHRKPIALRRAPLIPLFDKPAFSRLYQNCEQRIVVEIVGSIVKRLQNTQVIAFCSYRCADLRFPCVFYRGLNIVASKKVAFSGLGRKWYEKVDKKNR